jgi:CyaY protein
MTDLEYLNLAESALRAVELSCDHINDETTVDLDNQRVGGMITLTFANKSQIVVNLQKPLHEIWVAARQGGHHFKWIAGQWRDTKNEGELFRMLSQFATEQAGSELVFTAEA